MTSPASLSAELALSEADNVIPGIVIQSALFGLETSLCLRGLMTKQPLLYRYINSSYFYLDHYYMFMMTASLAMYIASGMHWVSNVYAAMRVLRDARAGRASFSIHTLYVLSEVGSIALFFNFWISDMVVMWRACVLWGWCLRVKITFGIFVIVPAVLALIDVSTTRPAATDTIFEPNLFGFVALLVSLISNVWATSLIGYKAWISRKEICNLWGPGGKMPPAQGILVLLAESGSLYSIVWVTFIASTAYTMMIGSTPITHAISDFIPSFVGLYPTVIIVLVSRQMTHWEEDSSLSPVQDSPVLSFSPP
ncbi:hypothetical protein BDP27DRAFT_1425261 [Rhodocollybia butyracea]|uniref:Uncharacterized protein n=1 Tax=Rhodocollybia butyracea TaxID=206335 RepID=A0A9P5U2S5_9AGAR|nr:hypothetical protein BDP27DRAFT_1425261 [Rhodocollybia butyracea]